jgi:5-methylcytosine-specific restriction endonuclease McrA
MLYRRCGRCGKRIVSGTKCTCLKNRHKEYDKYSRDRRSKDFYNSKEWARTRREVLEMDDGIDVYVFVTTGEIVLADTVHHIVPLKTDWSQRLNKNNLMSLHHDTHSKIEDRYKAGDADIVKELMDILEKFRSIET